MKIRLYVDEDAMAHALINGLRARSIDVVSVLDEGMSEHNDLDQLMHTTKKGRVLYTFNSWSLL